MRVVQAGTKNQRVFRGTCHHCGCIFEEDERNLTVQSEQRDGEWANVTCPQCGNTNANMYPKQPERLTTNTSQFADGPAGSQFADR